MSKDAITVNIRPCPFCGEVPGATPWHGGAPTKILISCRVADHGGCHIAPGVTGETPEEAVEKWNGRYEAASMHPVEVKEW